MPYFFLWKWCYFPRNAQGVWLNIVIIEKEGTDIIVIFVNFNKKFPVQNYTKIANYDNITHSHTTVLILGIISTFLIRIFKKGSDCVYNYIKIVIKIVIIHPSRVYSVNIIYYIYIDTVSCLEDSNNMLCVSQFLRDNSTDFSHLNYAYLKLFHSIVYFVSKVLIIKSAYNKL